MSLKYKGLILCIVSFLFSFISTVLLILGAYNKNTPLVVVSVICYIICFTLIAVGAFLIYKGSKKDV